MSVIPLDAHPDLHFSKSFLPTTHHAGCLFTRRPRFFVARRTVTNLSLSFASIQHVLLCCSSPLPHSELSVKLSQTQAVCDLIPCIDPSQIGFTGHCLGLDCGQFNRQSLVCRRLSFSFFLYCIVKALAVGDKNAGTSLEELLIILEHKFTAGHLFPHRAHPTEMFLTGRHTACLCSQTAADNPLDLLALPLST